MLEKPPECVTCPIHGSRFDVTTGLVIRGPGTTPIKTYRVEVKNDIASARRLFKRWAQGHTGEFNTAESRNRKPVRPATAMETRGFAAESGATRWNARATSSLLLSRYSAKVAQDLLIVTGKAW